MKSRITALALSVAATALPAVAGAQQSGPVLYAFHSMPASGCPGLDWHVTVEPNNTLVGFVAWDGGKHLARLDGTIHQDRTFAMDAKEVGGQQRSAVVKGTAAGEYIAASISGSGTACDDKILNIPRVVGGIGGGGG